MINKNEHTGAGHYSAFFPTAPQAASTPMYVSIYIYMFLYIQLCSFSFRIAPQAASTPTYVYIYVPLYTIMFFFFE
jgi:hypothetical protein